MDTVSRSEQVESDLDRLITKRHDQRATEGAHKPSEDLWAESVRRHNLKLERDELIARYLYHRAHRGRIGRMASGLMAEHDAAAEHYAAKLATKHGVNVEALENGQEQTA